MYFTGIIPNIDDIAVPSIDSIRLYVILIIFEPSLTSTDVSVL